MLPPNSDFPVSPYLISLRHTFAIAPILCMPLGSSVVFSHHLGLDACRHEILLGSRGISPFGFWRDMWQRTVGVVCIGEGALVGGTW